MEAREFSIRLGADIEEIPRLVAGLVQFGAAMAVPEDVLFDIQLVLDELIVNALRHGYAGAPGGEIHVRVVHHGDRIGIVLSDDAPLFDPFSAPPPALEQGVDERPLGGLGVHLVRTLMDETNYAVENGRNQVRLSRVLKRQAEPSGTAPPLLPAQAHARSVEGSEVDITRAHILVVDDIEDNRSILTRRMRRLGFDRLAEAEDGIAALDYIRAHPVDLVLLDVMMPGMNGVEVLETIRREGRLEDISVIMISANSEIETVVKCLELGAEDYLPKPFNPAILRARIGSVLERKLLRAEHRRQLARLEAEMATARRQQLSMLPTDFASPSGRFDLHAVMQPALEVGGDLYDFFELSDDVLCLAVGDVSGKGMPAALFMARTRSLLRAGALQFQAIAGRPPRASELAALLNHELCKNNEDCLFITMIVGFLDLGSGLFRYVNAGHLPPLRLHASGADEVKGPVDPPLGVVDGLVFEDGEIQLRDDDMLVFITDGLSEMEDVERNMYTAARLLRDLHELPGAGARVVAEHLVSCVFGHAGGARQYDDVTVLAIRLPPAH